MTTYPKIINDLRGSAPFKLARVLIAVYELADFAAGPEWPPLPVVGDIRSQLERAVAPAAACRRLAFRNAVDKYHGHLHAHYCGHYPHLPP